MVNASVCNVAVILLELLLFVPAYWKFRVNTYTGNIIAPVGLTVVLALLVMILNNKKYLYPELSATNTDDLVSSNKPAVPKPSLGTAETRQHSIIKYFWFANMNCFFF